MSLFWKRTVVGWAGILLIGTGAILRFNAHSLSWPANYSFSGPWENTDWGRQQIALEQCSVIMMAFGVGLLLLACHWWLKSTTSKAEPPAL